ncbi:putative auxin efflux carrier family protein [Aurantimonas manganoxydans SI85-9A1]|uniref:Putative auxin efflux carrier family protein n=1 Tax=Aurantimonas manganoxydans (strain ATCC BAA-1229 / DSM 21871 / SI85-9A1) TaxID=287752 RepID=Q1YG82_AURMS|nr:AEC family transporter [Aurantimonas manganoxydans]EAS49343.1 putative auxin efflux carrier family protein [Aurantimonas manganoxydans SI85-9A1]
MQTIFDVIVPIFSLIVIGFLFARAGLLSEATGEALARFVFVVAVPILLFRTLATARFGDANPLALWAAYFGGVAITWTAGTLLVRRLSGSDRRTGAIAGIAASFANTIFIAIPTLQRAYGDAGLEPLLVIVSIHLPVMMIASTLLIERAALLDARDSDGASAEAIPLAATMKRVARNLATNAIVIGILAGLAWRGTGLRLGSHLDEITGLLGSTAGPLALFSLGMSLTRYGLRGELVASGVVAVLSLVVMPAIVYAIGSQLGLPPLWLKGAVLTAAAPAGVNAYLFAVYFRSGEKFASSTLFVSTVLSVVTLSLWLTILG